MSSNYKLIIYALIATAVFAGVYYFYMRSGKPVGAGDVDTDVTGTENVGPGYGKPSVQSESEDA